MGTDPLAHDDSERLSASLRRRARSRGDAVEAGRQRGGRIAGQDDLLVSAVRLGGPAEETGDRVPGARLRAGAFLALSGSLLAVVPFSLGRLIEAVNGQGPTPLAADPGFTVIAIGVLVSAAAIASVPVAVITYLLDRVVERVWLGPGGRLAAGAVAHALIGGAAGLVLGGLVAPMWRPVGLALVFTGPWAAAAATLFLLASTTRRPGRRLRRRG